VREEKGEEGEGGREREIEGDRRGSGANEREEKKDIKGKVKKE
jgi:hypothetical protein